MVLFGTQSIQSVYHFESSFLAFPLSNKFISYLALSGLGTQCGIAHSTLLFVCFSTVFVPAYSWEISSHSWDISPRWEISPFFPPVRRCFDFLVFCFIIILFPRYGSHGFAILCISNSGFVTIRQYIETRKLV